MDAPTLAVALITLGIKSGMSIDMMKCSSVIVGVCGCHEESRDTGCRL